MKSSLKVAEVSKSQQKLLTIWYKIVKSWHKVVKSGKKCFQYMSALYEIEGKDNNSSI